jgi:hypothetical protein
MKRAMWRAMWPLAANALCRYDAAMSPRLLLPLVLVSTFGCFAEKHTYQVELTNSTNVVLSAGPVKELSQGLRPEMEDGWAAPEDVAINAPELTRRHWGWLIKPGQTVTIGPVTGSFTGGMRAVLRVYAGDRSVDDLLAISRKDMDRIDIPLTPGLAGYIVTIGEKGSLVFDRK